MDNDKWYDSKSDTASAAEISRANSEVSFEAREEVYKKHREGLTAQFRYIREFSSLFARPSQGLKEEDPKHLQRLLL